MAGTLLFEGRNRIDVQIGRVGDAGTGDRNDDIAGSAGECETLGPHAFSVVEPRPAAGRVARAVQRAKRVPVRVVLVNGRIDVGHAGAEEEVDVELIAARASDGKGRRIL